MATIYKRDNTWYLQYSYQGKRIRKAIGKNKKFAEWAKADIEQKLEKAKAGFIDARTTIHTFFRETKKRINRKSPATKERYLQVLQHFDHWYFSQFNPPRYLNDISPEIISSFAAAEKLRGLAPSTINYELDRLHTFFLYYVRQKKIEFSPVANVQYFDVPDHVPRFFSIDEIKIIFDHLSPRYIPHFTTFLYTGIRRDELRFLHWSDVKDNLIRIRPKPEWTPKSKSSIRTIPQHPKVVEAIASRKRLGESNLYVFSNKSGNVIHRNNLLTILKRAMNKAGINNGNIHTFRHTFASHLVQSGVSIYKVSKLLGHHSVKQTEIYAHLAPSEDKFILNALDFS